MDNQLYVTPDRGLAAYLVMRGCLCVGTVPANDPSNTRRLNFILVDVTNPKEYEEMWYRNREEVMSAGKYFKALTKVVRMAKEPMTTDQYAKLRGEA